MIDALYNGGLHLIAATWWSGAVWPVLWNLLKIVCIVAPLMGAVAYLTLWERKLLGFMQVRFGPNRVGPFGLLQPMADGLKLITKELIQPTASAKGLFYLGPIMAIMPALAAWVAIPFGPTSIEVYGVIIAGWASNSKYALLGALRASAQMVSYEIAMGFCFLVVIMVSGSMNLTEIVLGQAKGSAFGGIFAGTFAAWNWLPLLPIFVVYLISVVAEVNRHPFDVVEGEAEIVAGHMVEYSGMGFAVFFLAEYASMWLVSILAVIMFLGGWLPPLPFLDFIPGWIWLGAKTFLVVSMFIWIRATFPRFRYDQIMRLGWKIFIPVTLIWLLVVAAWLLSPWNIWK